MFIAFDKAEAAAPRAKKILEGSALIHLYDDHELFGQPWSKIPVQSETARQTV